MNSLTTLIQTLGGLGLFLLGMIVMTDGLKNLAGDSIRSALMRYTRTPLSGALTGAMSTAILQSSSATTVAAVGFVGAGLMSFQNSLGIIFGANIGTTITGWMVVLLGFKLKLSLLVLPLIFIGAVLRLFSRGWLAQSGFALAGFGLIFIGISTLQEGMQALQGLFSFEQLPATTLAGRLKLVTIGMLFTVITQSSSAGVAASLTALFANLINFEQAAALIIGMDIGTTMTAAMATVGGTVNARRTGFSHVIYNFFTAFLALCLVTPYMMLWDYWAPGYLLENAEIALVGFHTFYNTLGVIVILPFSHTFAHLMIRILPEKLQEPSRHLEPILLEHPDLALNVVQKEINDHLITLLRHLNSILGDNHLGNRANLEKFLIALNATRAYLDRIHLDQEAGANWQRLIAQLNTLDHLQRLFDRCEEDEYRAQIVNKTPDLSEEKQSLLSGNQHIIADINLGHWSEARVHADLATDLIKKTSHHYRKSIVAKIGRGQLDVSEGTKQMGAIRWLRRTSQHINRICYYLEQAVLASGK